MYVLLAYITTRIIALHNINNSFIHTSIEAGMLIDVLEITLIQVYCPLGHVMHSIIIYIALQ